MTRFAWETWSVLYESALFVLAGFLLAGFLHAFLKTERIMPWLGGRGLRSVAGGAALGAPLPLCSCAVVPTAVALWRKGASREATMSFLISTPETGVDSVAITYALLGPVYAVARPLTAVATAIAAGIAHRFLGRESEGGARAEAPAAQSVPAAACEDGCHPELRRRGRLGETFRYGFVTLFDDLTFWLLTGILLSGLIGALLPDGVLSVTRGNPLVAMLCAALVGIPLYMCASSSTPLAAGLLAKGLDPGAALVFLLTGPATNAATISVVSRTLGRRFTMIYLASILVVAMAAGLVLNAFYQWDPAHATGSAAGGHEGGAMRVLHVGAVIVFVALAAWSFRRTGFRSSLQEMRGNLAACFAPLKRLAGRARIPTAAP